MKKLVKVIIQIILWLLVTILATIRFIPKSISILYRLFYSEWKRREFKRCGRDIIIFPKIHVIGGENIIVGTNVVISENSTISAWSEYGIDNKFNPEIFISDGCAIGSNSHITAINSIILGKGVLLGKNVTITDNSHGMSSIKNINTAPRIRPLFSKGSVVINENVWIGDKATILPGVTIGENSIIGANTVVTKDVPSNCVAAGNPAKIVKLII